MPVLANGTAYDLTGPSNAPVLVLIHGLGLTRQSTWRAMIPLIAAHYRVLSYDLCGHGETGLPDDGPSLTVLSEQVIALMDALDIGQAALVGFSLGGMINRRCAMDHPDRVSALVILNSPHERGDVQQKLVENRARDTGSGGPAANIDETLARWFTDDFRKQQPDVVEQTRKVVLANHPDNYAAHRLVLAEGVTELIRPDPPISHPTLVMTCENDSGSTPAMSHAIASEIAGAKVHIARHLQHLGLIQDPKGFCDPIKAYLGPILTKDKKDTA